jgi:hypothetical protein
VLDISVHDLLGMEIGKCVGHPIDVDGAALFGEATILHEQAHARKEDALFVAEVTVEAETFGCRRFC